MHNDEEFRDIAAVFAMQALIPNRALSPQGIAEEAFMYADAMLAEKKKRDDK